MGLDTFASRIEFDSFEEEDHTDGRFGCTRRDRLAFWLAEKRRERDGGCIFGGNYFRGKLYVSLIQQITGVRIYQTWIPPGTVREMSKAFDRCDPEAEIRTYNEDAIREESVETIRDLRAFFGVCARRGLGLVGSW